MTLTALLPTKALAALLAALLLSTALAVAVPTQTELPGVLNVFDVNPAAADTQRHCYDETVYVTSGGSFYSTETVTRCIDIPHRHWWERVAVGVAVGVGCGTFAVAVGGATGGVGGFVAGAACGTVMAGAGA